MFTFARTTAKAVILAAGTAGFIALGAGIASAAVLDGAAETRPQLSPEELTSVPGDLVGPYSPTLASLSDQVGGEVSDTAGVRDALRLVPADSARLLPVQERHAQRSAQPDRDIPTVDGLLDELAGIDATFTPVTDTNRHAQHSVLPDRDIPTVDGLLDELAGIDATFTPVTDTNRHAQSDRGFVERQVVGSPVTELPGDVPGLVQAAADDLPVRVPTQLENVGTGVLNAQPPVGRQSQVSPLPLRVSTPPTRPGSADLTVWPGTITETETARTAEQTVDGLVPSL
ncbi:hypothetical protein [Actinorugispora endophytica]|uniref:Uncharacterized protein n=1 Tax=Actinorugispora endophytica TaxID=1605990 RepID=A0A4R6V2A9_9ACTN|nr:hypothetical protein [Actinorugispora endophytica]TDQ52214.1 hypothetical protein EV190_10744 [Actinorugispora endophytica]